MKLFYKTILAISLGLSLFLVSAQAQQTSSSRFLELHPPTGLSIVPVFEGWYGNEDGSVTFSFGFANRNSDQVVEIPLGTSNFIEPAEYDGMQPSVFDSGRHHGVFTVTLPASMRDESVWWHIKTGNNDILKVPGRATAAAYELDSRPRPAGTVEPKVWLEENGEQGSGPTGIVGTLEKAVSVGTPVTLTAYAQDPSMRDPEDPRFQKPIPIRLTWSKHQGPGNVEFARHETTQDVPPQQTTRRPDPNREPPKPGPEEVTLAEAGGTANVIATFSEPGEYILRIRVDNWRAPDSSGGDQCCWTNAYQRISVSE